MSARIKARAMGKPALLRSVTEIETARESLLADFLRWFETIPGAEWEIGSTDGMLLYCHYYANAEHPEWGKVFHAHRIDHSIEFIQRAVAQKRHPPISWDHWQFYGLLQERDCNRQTITDRLGELYREYAAGTEGRRMADIAYSRIVSDLWVKTGTGCKGR
jgi:hypothetical protein